MDQNNKFLPVNIQITEMTNLCNVSIVWSYLRKLGRGLHQNNAMFSLKFFERQCSLSFTKEKHQFHEKSYIIKNTKTHTNNAYVRIEHLGSNVLLSHMGSWVYFRSPRDWPRKRTPLSQPITGCCKEAD